MNDKYEAMFADIPNSGRVVPAHLLKARAESIELQLKHAIPRIQTEINKCEGVMPVYICLPDFRLHDESRVIIRKALRAKGYLVEIDTRSIGDCRGGVEYTTHIHLKKF